MNLYLSDQDTRFWRTAVLTLRAVVVLMIGYVTYWTLFLGALLLSWIAGG